MTTLLAPPAPPLRDPAPVAERRPARRLRPDVVLIVVVMWVYAAICVLPLITMVLNSFRTHLDIATVPWPWPVEPTLENYVNAWNQASFSTYTVNSVIVTVSSVVISTAVSLMAAYALTRWPFRGRALVEGLFVSGLMIPFMLAILPIFYLMDWLRLIDSPLALVLVYSAGGIPFSIFVFTAFFRNTPRELEEAAYMDGASHFGVFFRVVLPLVRPVIATVAVFRFVPIWNDFLMPLVLLRSRDNYTLGVGLSTFFGEYQTDWASLFAGLVIATLPLVVLFVVATRQIIDGLTAGIGK